MSDLDRTARVLAALGHPARLAIARLLVRAGPAGLSVGVIGDHLAMPLSTLSHHLSALKSAGLVSQRREGRTTYSQLAFREMHAAIAFLTDECCTGFAEPTGPDGPARAPADRADMEPVE